MSDGDPSRVARYLAHLDDLSGGQEPMFFPVDIPGRSGHKVTAICYPDLPTPGLLTVFTYGLSLFENPAWVGGRPELSLCVASDDLTWGLALAYMAAVYGDECPFSYGNAIGFGEPIADGTELDGFVIFAPGVVAPDQARVDVGEELPIHIVGAYPTYEAERHYVADQGLAAFWEQEWDAHDVRRPAVAAFRKA